MNPDKFKTGDKVKWEANARLNAGSGTIKSYATTGEGRARKRRATIERSTGGWIKLFDSQLHAA